MWSHRRRPTAARRSRSGGEAVLPCPRQTSPVRSPSGAAVEGGGCQDQTPPGTSLHRTLRHTRTRPEAHRLPASCTAPRAGRDVSAGRHAAGERTAAEWEAAARAAEMEVSSREAVCMAATQMSRTAATRPPMAEEVAGASPPVAAAAAVVVLGSLEGRLKVMVEERQHHLHPHCLHCHRCWCHRCRRRRRRR